MCVCVRNCLYDRYLRKVHPKPQFIVRSLPQYTCILMDSVVCSHALIISLPLSLLPPPSLSLSQCSKLTLQSECKASVLESPSYLPLLLDSLTKHADHSVSNMFCSGNYIIMPHTEIINSVYSSNSYQFLSSCHIMDNFMVVSYYYPDTYSIDPPPPPPLPPNGLPHTTCMSQYTHCI